MIGTLPELDDGRRRRDFSAEGNGAGVPIVPAHGEAQCIIDIAGTVLGYGTGQRKPGRHLSQRLHHGIDSDTGKGISEQDRERTGLGKGTADTQEQTRANGATEGNELDVSRFEAVRPG